MDIKKTLSLYLLASLLTGCGQPQNESQKSDVTFCTQSKASLKGIEFLGDPILKLDIGNSSLTISTKSKEAQKWFNQGLNMLHGFWHLEAYRAFEKVIELDPNCAMGYWGKAMCQPGFGGKELIWKTSIQKAVSLMESTTQIEKDLINCSQSLLTQGLSEQTLSLFEKLAITYPNEPEALAFAGIMHRQVNTPASQNKAKIILENALQRFPQKTAIAHYYTHLVEAGPDFLKAESVIENMASEGNQSPHLVHMPGHIYFLKGEYKKAIQAFKKAKELDFFYHKNEKIPYLANQNFLHNLHYLTVAYAENGSYDEAIGIANQYAKTNLRSSIPNDASTALVYYDGLILPAFVDIRFRKWPKASEYLTIQLNKLDKPINSPLIKAYFQAINHFCKGMLAIEVDDHSAAQIELDNMMVQIELFNNEGLKHKGGVDFQNINKAFDIMEISRLELLAWIENIDPSKEFDITPIREALLLEENIGYAEPPVLIYPVFESMGLILQKRNDPRAKEVLTEALRKRPKSKIIEQYL